CDVTYPFADTTKVDLLSRQRSALGAHVPQNRSDTVRWRTLSASAALETNTEAKAMMVRMVLTALGGTRNATPDATPCSSPGCRQPAHQFLPDKGSDRLRPATTARSPPFPERPSTSRSRPQYGL